jgi:hypothetical protein
MAIRSATHVGPYEMVSAIGAEVCQICHTAVACCGPVVEL